MVNEQKKEYYDFLIRARACVFMETLEKERADNDYVWANHSLAYMAKVKELGFEPTNGETVIGIDSMSTYKDLFERNKSLNEVVAEIMKELEQYGVLGDENKSLNETYDKFNVRVPLAALKDYVGKCNVDFNKRYDESYLKTKLVHKNPFVQLAGTKTQEESKPNKNRMFLWIGISVAILIVLAIIVFFLIIKLRKKNQTLNVNTSRRFWR